MNFFAALTLSKTSDLYRIGKRIMNFLNFSRILLGLTVPVYLIIQYILLVNHILWRDEAHALLLVTQHADLRDFLRAMQYEGSPIFAHLILWILNRAIHLTPERFQMLHFLVGILILFAAITIPKLPNPLKLLMLFQLPMFEYLSYVRQYTLVILFLFLFLNIYLRNERSPWLYVILFILTQLSLHSCLIGFGLWCFLLFNNYGEGQRIFKLIYILPVIGIVLCGIQMVPPADLMEGTKRWKPFLRWDSFNFVFVFIEDVFFKNSTIGFLCAIFLGGVSLHLIRCRKRLLFLVLMVLGMVGVAFYLIGCLKYSCPRHHWLFSFYAYVLFMICFQSLEKQPAWLLMIAMLVTLLGLDNLLQAMKEGKNFVSSHSRNVAEYLDRKFPEKEVLIQLEYYADPLLVYRKHPSPVFAVGRQEYIKHVVWNHPSVDYAINDKLQMKLNLSVLVENIQKTPPEILNREPIVILGTDGFEGKTGTTFSKFQIDEKRYLELVQAFTGATHENYLVYKVCRTPSL